MKLNPAKKIVLVTSWYPEKINCKKGTFALHDFAKALKLEGHDVLVINTQKPLISNTYNYVIDTVQVQSLPIVCLRHYFRQNKAQEPIPELEPIPEHKLKLAYRYVFRAYRYVFRVLLHYSTLVIARLMLNKIKNYDLAIIHGNVELHYLLLQNIDIKKVAVLHASDMRYGGFLKQNYHRFHGVAFRTGGILNNFVQKFNLELSNPVVLPSGIADDIAIPFERYKKTTNKSNIRLVTVARLIPRKNIDLLITALSKINTFNWTLDIFGEGPELDKLKKIAQELRVSDRVFFKSHINNNILITKLNEYDVFALLSKNETLGLAYLEALSQGVIVLGSRNEGIDGIIINNYNGFLADYNDLNDVIEKLISIFTINDNELLLLKKRIYERNQTFLSSLCNKNYTRFIDSVLHQ